jgi:hypothetical protein
MTTPEAAIVLVQFALASGKPDRGGPPAVLRLATKRTGSCRRWVGGLSVALGATLKTVEPQLKLPHAGQWDTAFRIFDQRL